MSEQTRLKVTILNYTSCAEFTVGTAGRLCYSEEGFEEVGKMTSKEARDFVRKLISFGHESPLEHITFTFGLEGVSRSLLAQLSRHRHQSMSVKSQRYCTELDFKFIIPPEIENIPEAKKIFIEAMEQDQAAYNKLADILSAKHFLTLTGQGIPEKKALGMAEKAAIEDSRFVLSNAVETKIMLTANARALLNVFSKRCCSRAQWEFRDMAQEMLRLVKDIAPAIFEKAGPPCLKGSCSEGKMSCGRLHENNSREE